MQDKRKEDEHVADETEPYFSEFTQLSILLA